MNPLRFASLGSALCALALFGSSSALAQIPDYPASVWAAEYRSVDQMEEGIAGFLQLLNQSGNPNGNVGQARQVPLPFGFRFFGSEPFLHFNVGAKGYVTFGTQTASAHNAGLIGPQLLVQTSNPMNLIAAWWGDHFCSPEGAVKTLVLGNAPNRRFVIEWDGCSKLVTSNSGSSTTFQTQIWLTEGSDVIQVKYGEVNLDPSQRWSSVSWGLKPSSGVGFMGPDAEGRFGTCTPLTSGTTCNATHFPSNSVIQYGLWEEADLAARLVPALKGVSASGVELEAAIELFNTGKAAVDGVGFDLYLATSPTLAPGELGTHRIDVHPSTEDFEGGESRSFDKMIDAPRPPNDLYRLCIYIDPNNTLAERDRENNWTCSHEQILLGPDLTGTIVGPTDGSPGVERLVRFTIRNDGNDRAGAFSYRVIMTPFSAGIGVSPELVYTGRLEAGLGAGESAVLDRMIQLPSPLRAARYTFDLEIDFGNEVEDADRSNNVIVSAPMNNHRPHLHITRSTMQFELVDGCFYGEKVKATFEICNEGGAEALGFRPGIVMGDAVINAAFDVSAAADPGYCGRPGTWNYRACEPVGARPASCAFEFCRVSCMGDGDCVDGQICVDDPLLAEHLGVESARSCMNYLAEVSAPGGPHCRTWSLEGIIPFENQIEAPYAAGPQYFHLIDDVLHSLSQERPDSQQLGPFDCRPALLDLAAVEVEPTSPLVVGKAVSVRRLIRNEGFINFLPGSFTRPASATFRYQYFLSTVPEVSTHQIPLPFEATGDFGVDTITRKGTSQRTDLIRIPPDVLPGSYYLGMILDPEGEFEELDKRNNAYVLPDPIQVVEPGLRILTGSLPRANLHSVYHHQLVSVGGEGMPVWSAEDLPPGMSLGEDGLLHGTPTVAGTFAFTVHLQAGTATTQRMLALLVHPAQSELEIATRLLPYAVKGMPYGRWFNPVTLTYQDGVQLVASGGIAPYQWELDPFPPGSRLPQGLEGPTPEGLILGQPTPMSESSRFRIVVTDAQGNQAQRWLEIEVVEESTLRIPNRAFPMGISGRDYLGCLEAQGGDGSYHWQLDEDSLPAGLGAEPEGARLCLVGMPTVCGEYTVDILLQDGQGQASAVAASFSIECGAIQLNARAIHPVRRGDQVEMQLGANPSNQPRFRILQGRLPSGLALADDGLISGTVADDATFGAHDLILELSDALGRRGLSALTVRVEVDPEPLRTRTTRRPDCSSAGGSPAGLGTFALLGLGLFMRAGRRRISSPSGASARAKGSLPLLGLVAALGVAMVACGEESITTAIPRCEGKVCGENFECDEADGQCKCGGLLICKEGDGCNLSPSPHCVSLHCEFTECAEGQTCNPETGLCQCGNQVCEEGERCVDGACVQQDPCDEVGCGLGLVCDPVDLRCKCGGELCEDGEVCVDGACTPDPCSGVQCGANSVCDPEDGICRCGGGDGTICNTGEACLEEDGFFLCGISSLCDDVRCVGGSVCDPDDGQCRCGGVGNRHPVCDVGQSCVDGACRAGDLCAPGGVPTVCELGSSCDPTDGICKCGGMHGQVCEANEACTLLGGEERCLPLCELLSPAGCGEGRGCYFDLSQFHGESFCAPAGPLGLNEPCEAANDCAPGLHCSQAGVCTKVCHESSDPDVCDDAGPGLSCSPFHFGSSFGYCRAL